MVEIGNTRGSIELSEEEITILGLIVMGLISPFCWNFLSLAVILPVIATLIYKLVR